MKNVLKWLYYRIINIKIKTYHLIGNMVMHGCFNGRCGFKKYNIVPLNSMIPNKRVLLENDYKEFNKIVSQPMDINNIEVFMTVFDYSRDYLYEVDDAMIVPGTDTIIKKDCIYSDRFTFDKDAETVLDTKMLVSFDTNHVVLKSKNTVELKGGYFNLCFNGGGNIWHLTFDMLSKFRIINNMERIDQVSILMDECLERNSFAQEYISCFNKYNYPIKYLDKDIIYSVEKVYLLPSAYVFNRAESQHNDIFFINRNFVRYARELMFEKLISSNLNRIYIKRGDKRLNNEDELIELAKKYGFKIIQPEKYSFYEELGLFKSANLVMGTIGAAFTNLIYTQSLCKTICIAPYERIGLVNAYSTITNEIGGQLFFSKADTISNSGSGTPGLRFNANIKEIERILIQMVDEL